MTTPLAAHSPGEILAAYLTAIFLAVLASMIVGAIAAFIRLAIRDRRGKSTDELRAAAIAKYHSGLIKSAPAIRIHLPHTDRHRSVAPAAIQEARS